MKRRTETHPCACGCGTPVVTRDHQNRPRRYAYNHHLRGKRREKFGGKVLADQPRKN